MARTERDALGLATWAMFLRTHAAVVSRLEREMQAERQLPLAWYDVLLELHAAPGRRLRMQELGNQVVLSRSRVSRIVDEMTLAGLSRREPDPDDRRGAHAVLTDAGRAALRAASPVYLRGINEHFTGHLEDTQLRAVHDALARVLRAQEAAGNPRPPVRRQSPSGASGRSE